ncbi:hypothetical protein [Microbacterium sp. 77mftsu3.1]|uniref:hypothetical protein n=1 Tax=Microbacterium sp. 77mftsu3.1 TaxID=1761802 RepID=UPI000366A774|nr:hypothetical protein [Microbacterium sp. 77mftsu3.1]SDH38561.1 hypothetical protein SAMN04488590_3199 [Microbacterium sp. 77mftsu3.1]
MTSHTVRPFVSRAKDAARSALVFWCAGLVGTTVIILVLTIGLGLPLAFIMAVKSLPLLVGLWVSFLVYAPLVDGWLVDAKRKKRVAVTAVTATTFTGFAASLIYMLGGPLGFFDLVGTVFFMTVALLGGLAFERGARRRRKARKAEARRKDAAAAFESELAQADVNSVAAAR